MRYVQLRAFHHVAVCGGFSRAAEALHLTQPAVSDQVRKLEIDYDIRLFDRNRKQVALTSHGEKLLEFTHRLFEVEQQAAEYLNAERTLKSGRLNIIADSPHHILHLLGPFRQRYPDVFVSIHSGNSVEVLESLYSYKADVGVLGDIPDSRDFDVMRLSSTPIIAFAPQGSEVARKGSLTLKELAKLPLVLREQGSKTRAMLEEYASGKGVRLNAGIEVEGREAVRDVVLHGGGVGIVSEAEFDADSGLVKIPIRDARLVMDEALITLKERRDSRIIRALTPFLKPRGE
ncbi:LysR substrate-binding domain-containing protein [Salaquimonas pukyongi]|uniref:LysR substrate-binding domain-containing protein n=1 Tax=Salaquimonas pukyongi TaxID=2712698 RepID=UPI00096B9BEC|nr:LysR substrate-binding domain-containing protein [Salaquimonas pukyongi]